MMESRRRTLERFFEKLKTFLSIAFDLIILNMLLLVFSVPIITAGAAETACYSCLIQVVHRDQQRFPFQRFFAVFKDSFRAVTPIWMLEILIVAILCGDAFYAAVICNPVSKFFLILPIVIGSILFLAALWFYPLAARFENTRKGQVKNAFLMAFARLPRTILALLIHVVIWAIPVLISDLFVYFGWFWILFGLSLPRYMTVKLFRDALQLSKPQADMTQMSAT
jgi:uncharacterized membrane protein YesL